MRRPCMQRMRSAALRLLLGLTAAMVAGPSFAEPPPTLSASAKAQAAAEDAEAFSTMGKAASAAGKIDEAYVLYQAAWILKQTHDISGNLAQVEMKLGKKRDAAEHLAFTLGHFPSSV